MEELKEQHIAPGLVRAQPQDAAKILWLLQGQPPFSEIQRSDLFKESALVLPDAHNVAPKLAHSEVLVDFLGKIQRCGLTPPVPTRHHPWPKPPRLYVSRGLKPVIVQNPLGFCSTLHCIASLCGPPKKL